jgi:putative transposase
MPDIQLTVTSEQIQALFRKDKQLATLLEHLLNQVLQAQVTEHLQAEPHERTDQRTGYRNGTRLRRLTTRVGSIQVLVPQVRDGSFTPDLFLRYQRSEQALLLAMLEMVIQGVSTRKVAAITQELCGTTFSKSTVSDLCQQLDPLVDAWNTRSLQDQRMPFVLVDALVLKVREDAQVRAMSALVASGINEAGYREILGVQIGDSESTASWSTLFIGLKERGLHGVDVVVADQHGGLVVAVRQHFQGATWQRCQTHLARNVIDAAPKAVQAELREHLRPLFTAPDAMTAREGLTKFVARFEVTAPKAVAVLERGFEDAIAVLALPALYRRRLRTTNSQERLNEELRRRERVIRIFPNRASALRLMAAQLMEYHEQWTTGRKYFEMAEYWAWKAALTSPGTPSIPSLQRNVSSSSSRTTNRPHE